MQSQFVNTCHTIVVGSKFGNFAHFWFNWTTWSHENWVVHLASIAKSKGTVSVELCDTVTSCKLLLRVWICLLWCHMSSNKEEQFFFFLL